jgi:site-specific DNA recombinase
MRVALYARVSTEAQQVRGTITSQLEALRARAAAEGDQVVAQFCDDGYSGARLDRPGLDGLRDAAEAGVFEVVWCLSPDRLARAYAWQVLVLDELARLGVAVRFVDAPALDDDPQARLLTQVQGVIAEYERAKIAERYRRGKLWRSRVGEVVSWKAPYGYRRVPRSAAAPAQLVVFEPEAQVVRRVFDDYVAVGLSMRQITRRLNADRIASPTGKPVWGVSTVGRLLRNQAYVGRAYYNRTELVPARTAGRRPTRQRPRPRTEWIAIPVPSIVADDLFEAAQQVSRDNSQFSPRRAEPGAWLLRGLVKCGSCGVGVNCHKMRGRNGTWHRYYYCRNHDPLRAGGEHRRCPERNIRADELDAFVFDQVRAALLRPEVLAAGQATVAARQPTPDDELLGAQLARLQRKLDAAQAERRRLVDLYQAGLLELTEVQRRAAEVDARRQQHADQQVRLTAERGKLAEGNRLRQRLAGFAERVTQAFDGLDFNQRQRLLRLVVERVRVTGQQVEIHLRIPLDEPPNDGPPARGPSGPTRPSTDMRLRSLGGDDGGVVQEPVQDRRCHDLVGEDRSPVGEPAVGSQHDRAALVAPRHDLEHPVRRGLVHRQVAELVDDQHRRASEGPHLGAGVAFQVRGL